MVPRQLVRNCERDGLSVLALGDLWLGTQWVSPVTVVDWSQSDASLERCVITILSDRNGLSGRTLCLNPAPELVETFGGHTGWRTELVVAFLHRFAHHTLTEADGVLCAVDHHIGVGLTDAVLAQSGFELDEAVLNRTVAT